MATTIATNVGTASSTATGNPGQGHLIYSANTGLWYCFYLSSTQTLNLAYASAVNTTWTVSSTPFTLANAHNQEGRDFGFNNVSIGGADYVHMCSTYAVSSTTKSYHARFKLDNGVNPNTGWTTTNSETQETTRGVTSAGVPSGASVIINSGGKVAECNSFISSGSAMTDQRFLQYPNADTAAAWTIGTPTQAFSYAPTTYVTSNAFADLGSGNLLNVCDNANTTGGLTQLEWSKWTTSWSAAALALSATITPTSTCNWGLVARTTTEVHLVVLSNNSSTFIHRIFNGTSWANGASIASLTLQSNSGVFLATDGTSVWAIVIDSTNRIAYSKYSGGTWAAWATLEAAGATNRFRVTGFPTVAAGGIGVIWTEVNGSNFNIVGSVLGMPQTATLTTATASVAAPAISGSGSGDYLLAFNTVAASTVSAVSLTGGGSSGILTVLPTGGGVTTSAVAVSGAATGDVSTPIDVGSVTTSLSEMVYVADQFVSLGAADVVASLVTVTAQGTTEVSTTLSAGGPTVEAQAISGAPSGEAGGAITAAGVGVSLPTLSALGTSEVATAPGTSTVGAAAPTISGAATGNVDTALSVGSVSGLSQLLTGAGIGVLTTPLSVGSPSATAITISASGSESSSWPISPGNISVGSVALSGLGTDEVSTSLGTDTVSVTAPIFGDSPQVWPLGFTNVVTSAFALNATGSGPLNQSIDLGTVGVSSSTLSGAGTSGISVGTGAPVVSTTAMLLNGAPTGSPSISLGTIATAVSASNLTIVASQNYSLTVATVSTTVLGVSMMGNQEASLSVATIGIEMPNVFIPSPAFFIENWPEFVSLMN